MIGPFPVGGVVFACVALLAVRPIRRPQSLALLSWISTAAPNEVPFLFMYIVIASNAQSFLDGEISYPADWVSLAVAMLTVSALLLVAHRHRRAAPATEAALEQALDDPWPSGRGRAGRKERRRLPWLRILLVFWPVRPRTVERLADISYGDHGADNLLDVYRHRSRPVGAPTLIYLHGGGFRKGRKSFEALALVHHLARHGWTCISANYHLARTPADGFPEHLIDVKRIIQWARTGGRDYGVDPDTIFLAGSSAGARLTVMAALTANDPLFQPGFETADTTIAAGVCLYGYYGLLGGDERPPSDPLIYATPTAAPLFIVHGDHDTFTPVEGARHLVDGLRATSLRPVVYAELPGAQHSFDLFHSIRFERVIDAIEAFAGWVRVARHSEAVGAEALSRSST